VCGSGIEKTTRCKLVGMVALRHGLIILACVGLCGCSAE
jgi:hypothetical protein